ncbi:MULTISPECIES: hypothetical protein [Streptomyces]|uniref:hypothetical protein n=1 Tax=Streptomyces TaxID=1883 RepID=UPI0012FEF228|nr:hypothetical protein [Streptomyces katrae]
MNRLFRMAVLSLLLALPALFSGGGSGTPTTASAPAAEESVVLTAPAAPVNWAWD